MQLIQGKEISQAIREEARLETLSYVERGLRPPGLAVIQAGSDPASSVYVRNKEKACEKAGFASFKYEFPETVSEAEILRLVKELNDHPAVDGILCQLPLPRHINSQKIIEAMDPWKDVDAFHPENAGRLLLGLDAFLPCTPAAVLELLKRSSFSLEGMNAVVLGRSNIVGKPVSLLLLRENCSVTLCHSKSKDLAATCARADLLVSAMGRARMVGREYTNPQQIVIDVAINEDKDGKLCGDVDFANVAEHVKAITPVPGGVGPVTIAMLLKNTLKAYRRHLGLAQA